MGHIIDLTTIRTKGRPLGKIADDKLEAFLTEAEMLLVKPVIGDALFILLLQKNESDATNNDNTNNDTSETSSSSTSVLSDEKTDVLINGGTYTTTNGTTVCFSGLASAMSYYMYAKVVLCGDVESTRYGMVVKDDEYSTRLSQKERADIYHEALDIAHAYMKECQRYLIVEGCLKKESVTGKQQITGTRIRKIS